MDRVKSKVNIFFTTSYVIILGLAIPVVSNSPAAPQAVTSSQSADRTSQPTTNEYGTTVKVVTLDVAHSEKNQKSSISGAIPTSKWDTEHYAHLLSDLAPHASREGFKSESLRYLATVKLLN